MGRWCGLVISGFLTSIPFSWCVSAVCCGSRSILVSQSSVQLVTAVHGFSAVFIAQMLQVLCSTSGVGSSAAPAACCGWVHLPDSLWRSPTLGSLLLSVVPSIIGDLKTFIIIIIIVIIIIMCGKHVEIRGQLCGV